MTLGGATFFVIVHKMGGFSASMARVTPDLFDSEGSHQTAGTVNLHLHPAIGWDVSSHIHALAYSKKVPGRFVIL